MIEKYPLSNLNISDLMKTISEILHDQHTLLLHSDMSMVLDATTCVETVLKFTRAYSRVRKDRRITRGCKINVSEYLLDDYNK